MTPWSWCPAPPAAVLLKSPAKTTHVKPQDPVAPEHHEATSTPVNDHRHLPRWSLPEQVSAAAGKNTDGRNSHPTPRDDDKLPSLRRDEPERKASQNHFRQPHSRRSWFGGEEIKFILLKIEERLIQKKKLRDALDPQSEMNLKNQYTYFA